MPHDLNGLLIIALTLFAQALYKKYCVKPGVRAFDWFMQRFVLRTERRLWIWLHHKFGHSADNALHCEVAGCTVVTPLDKHID